MILDPYIILHTKYHSEWIIKLLEENTGVNFCDLDSDNDFFDMTPKAKALKGKYIHWFSSKLKTCVSKDIKKVKGWPTKWQKIFANITSHKRTIQQ